jgi:YggT family protein
MNPFVFLIDTLFYLYAMILMLRFMLQWTRADFYNPLSQLIVKLSNPLVAPLRRLIPGYGGLDLATLFLVFALTFSKLLLLSALGVYGSSIGMLLLAMCVEVIMLTLDIFLFVIFLQAILSWINPDPYHPLANVLFSLSRPALQPLRRFIQPVGGIDITPMIAIIIILFIKHSIRYFIF